MQFLSVRNIIYVYINMCVYIHICIYLDIYISLYALIHLCILYMYLYIQCRESSFHRFIKQVLKPAGELSTGVNKKSLTWASLCKAF